MYERLKDLLFRVLPQTWLYGAEYFFRYMYSLFFAGKNVTCNLCSGHFSGFVKLDGGDLLCPRCGSLARHRRLWMILQDMYRADPPRDVLHFSPARMISRQMKQLALERYHTSAIEPEAKTDHHYDLNAGQSVDRNYDLIICYHVLEHVDQDVKAMKTLFEILRPGGSLLVQTPLKPGDTYENDGIRSPEDRKIHFGQEDHLRIYSVAGLSERLKGAGFHVTPVTYPADPHYGLQENETVFYCKKG